MLFAAASSTLFEQLEGSFLQQLIFQLTGFAAVLSALVILWGAVALMGAIFVRLESKAVPEPVPAAPPTPQIQAAISAALHTVLKGPFRIAGIEKEAGRKRP